MINETCSEKNIKSGITIIPWMREAWSRKKCRDRHSRIKCPVDNTGDVEVIINEDIAGTQVLMSKGKALL